MKREAYVNTVVSKLVTSLQGQLRETIQTRDNVAATVLVLQDKLQTLLTNALNKSLDDVENRFQVYAQRCDSLVETDQFKKMQRSISKTERHVQTNFAEGEKEIFERKLARNHRHREALKNCFLQLTRDLNLPGSRLLDVLYEKRIMSTSDLDSIRARGSSEKKNEEFLMLVCGKLTLDDFHNVFLPTLQKDHLHLCERLVEEMDKLQDRESGYICISCRARNDVQVERLAAPLFRMKAIHISLYSDLSSGALSNTAKWAELEKHKVSHTVIIYSLERNYPDFHEEFRMFQRKTLDCFCQESETGLVVDMGRHSLLPLVAEDYPHYEDMSTGFEFDTNEGSFDDQKTDRENEMKQNGRGLCLIINNIAFDKTRLKQRDGSEKDGERLAATFKRLGFVVISLKDQTAAEIRYTVNEYSKQTDHSAQDAFICCLLSHGTRDLFYSADGLPIRISEITSEFTALKCPTLAGKPKLFFIQADRGKDKMKGYIIPSKESDMAAVTTEDVVADEADFLIGYCTPPGYVSYRSRSRGSWYIKTLCDVLDKEAEHQDILSCLLVVNDRVARANARGGEATMEKQVPAPVFTLRKKVFLTVNPSHCPV